MVIVDTSVWFDYFAGVSNAETGWLDVEMGKQRLGVTDLNPLRDIAGDPQ